jgi:predicted TIM-barrel fold metal-dependent hydrolase
MAERCQPPDPNPRAPRFACPPDAVDCHVHVYGPEAYYPVAPAATVIAPDALPSALNHLHAVLGIRRTVLVQPSTYGFDNRRHVDALAELGRPARLVASVPFDIARGELDRLTAAGACGARIAIGHAGGPTFDHVRRLADRVAPVGWHIEFHVRRPYGAQVLAPGAAVLRDLPVDLCIAHFASIEPGLGLGQSDVDVLCELLAAGRCWLKLSGGYRLSAAPPYRDLIPLAEKFAAARPDRLLWGSDWPHVDFRGRMFNSTEQLDALAAWVPDPALRRRILVDNPAGLYGF